jgi:predicted  nucleic acid-binding Zn-ribbon protein
MFMLRAFCVLALCCPTLGGDASANANPIRKIVTLMQDMQKEIDAEGAKEKVLFDKFMCFCDGGTADLEKTALDAKTSVKTLTARQSEMGSEKETLKSDIVSHQADLAAAEQDLEQAANIRDKEKSDFEAEYATKKASADALAKAVPAIEKGLAGSSLVQSPGGPSLVPALKRALGLSQQLTEGNRHLVLEYLNGKIAPAGSGSEVVGMLKSMLDEFTRASAELAASEASAAKAFAEMKATKEKDVSFAKEAIETKKTRAGALAVEIVQTKNGLEDSQEELEKTTTFLSTLEAQCAAKKKDWDYRCNMRAQEKAAIGQAIAILNDDDALDVFKKAASAFVQTHQTGLLQGGGKKGAVVQKVRGILDSVMKTQKDRSHQLEMIQYALISKGAVDFGAVVKMVDEMVATLKKQMADDAKHKDWCINELGEADKNMKAITDKSTSIDSSMEELTDLETSLTDDMAALKEAVASLDKDVASATETRKEEHEEYQTEIQLTETAITLIAKAKNRLQKFYNPTVYKAPPKVEKSMEEKIIAGGSSALTQAEMKFDAPDEWGFLQTHIKQPKAPETYGAYEPKGKKSGGVMALMDMISNELVQSKQAASFEEKTAQTGYTSFMAESQATRSQTTKSLTEKEAASADIGSRITAAKEAKHTTYQEMENVHTLTSSLHGNCDFIVGNFDAKVKARGQEIEGLNNAKAVLSGATFS